MDNEETDQFVPPDSQAERLHFISIGFWAKYCMYLETRFCKGTSRQPMKYTGFFQKLMKMTQFGLNVITKSKR